VQVHNISPTRIAYTGGTAANTTYAAPTISFTVPSNGYVIVSAAFNLNALTSFGGITFQIIVNGTIAASDTPTTANTWNLNAVVAGTAGGSMTVVVQYVVGATALSNPIFIHGVAMYLPAP
jgi:glucose dehydrogenase